MTRITRSIYIGAPPDAVWRVLVNIEAWPGWARQMKRLERLDPGPLAFGSRVRVTPKAMPGSVWEVTEYEERRSYTWTSKVAPGVRLTGGHVVDPDPDGVKATFWLASSGPLAAVLSPLLAVVFRRNTRLATEGLKAYVESTRA